jgi:hypothetical protein
VRRVAVVGWGGAAHAAPHSTRLHSGQLYLAQEIRLPRTCGRLCMQDHTRLPLPPPPAPPLPVSGTADTECPAPVLDDSQYHQCLPGGGSGGSLNVWDQCGGKGGNCAGFSCVDAPYPGQSCPGGTSCQRKRTFARAGALAPLKLHDALCPAAADAASRPGVPLARRRVVLPVPACRPELWHPQPVGPVRRQGRQLRAVHLRRRPLPRPVLPHRLQLPASPRMVQPMPPGRLQLRHLRAGGAVVLLRRQVVQGRHQRH